MSSTGSPTLGKNALTSRSIPPPLPRFAVATAAPPPPPKPLPRRSSIVKRALFGLVALMVLAIGSAWLLYVSIDPAEEARVAPGEGRAALGRVRSWGYQLQGVDIAAAARSEVDLLVVDETVDGAARSPLAPSALGRLKRKPNGERRLVLSYLSIGEAEDYRKYWRRSWVAPLPVATGLGQLAHLPALGATPARASARPGAGRLDRPLTGPARDAPPWLGEENAEWRGNYRVRYWHPDWQGLLIGSSTSAIDRIIRAGFDGVYLDRADVYSLWGSEQPTAKTDMIRLIEAIAAYARRQSPEFLVVMQNAEELLATSHLRRSLDAVAKEDLFYGIDGAERANSQADVASSLRYLELARRDGLPILVVEYLAETRKVADARRRLKGEGFIPYFGTRLLNVLGSAG